MKHDLQSEAARLAFSPAAQALFMYTRVRRGSTMYSVPSTARYLGYCEKGWPPVRISNRIPVITGDARLQKVASAKVTPACITH